MEVRLIDANIVKNIWNNKSPIGEAMQRIIDDIPAFDLEMLDIVFELRCKKDMACYELEKANKACAKWEHKCKDLEKQLANAKAEKDKMLKCLKQAADDNGGCYGCKWLDEETEECTHKLGRSMCDSKTNNMWEWNGEFL